MTVSRAIVVTDVQAASNNRYEVVYDGFAVGARPYTDREDVFSSVPAELAGLTYIQTAKDDERVSGNDDFLSFTTDRDAVVYVAHDSPNPPAWVSEAFVSTGLKLVIDDGSNPRKFFLFKKAFPAGPISLGANRVETSRARMYSVIIEPLDSPANPSPPDTATPPPPDSASPPPQDSTASSPAAVASVTIAPASATVDVGESVAFSATLKDAKGKELSDRSVSWSSSDASVATVNETGVAAGKGKGTATISATAEGVTGTASLTVTVPVTPPPSPPPPPPSAGSGIWILASDLAKLPTSGAAWDNVKDEADGNCGSVDLADQDDDTNVCIMAKALVFARTGGSSYRSDVISAIDQINNLGEYSGRALALGRELGAYVIAADLIDLKNFDPARDTRFRSKLKELLTTPTTDGPTDLVDCHEKRPNNWGAMCGFSRAAVAAYLGDKAELDRTAQVFKGYLGDRSSYAGFKFGDDLSWQCDPSKPVGINPVGCIKDGRNLDGVLPDDQRRGGSFSSGSWPPPKENYVWGGLGGALAQAVILHGQGYDVWNWQDQALFRAVRWLHDEDDFPADGDNEWEPHLTNHFYGASDPAQVPAHAGKNAGWTDWTH